MPQVFINIIGHNASGKSTIAKRLEKDLKLNRVSGDDFRKFLTKHILFFNRTDLSYPTDYTKVLKPVVLNYRLSLAFALIEAKENVIYEGSGANREQRQKYFVRLKKDFPNVKIILVCIEIPEEELLKRLARRDKKTKGARWTEVYYDYRKDMFEPPTADEADLLLIYNQHNYDDIKQAIKEFLAEV